jgi:hypothetical protein
MDHAILLRHLEQSKRHIIEGQDLIERQKNILADLERGGHDTTEAKRLLKNFEDIQRLHLADLERVQSELLELDAADGSRKKIQPGQS